MINVDARENTNCIQPYIGGSDNIDDTTALAHHKPFLWSSYYIF